MRWFFLILVVCNIALFAWFQQEQQMRDSLALRSEFGGVDVAPLRMLSEITLKLRERSVNRLGEESESPQIDVPGVQQNDGADAEILVDDSRSTAKCYSIGPFASEQSADQVVQLMPSELSAGVVQDAASERKYWVYVKSPSDVEARRLLMRDLQAVGLEVSIVQRGGLKGSLSLGRYKNEDLAAALHRSLRRQGYEAEIFSIDREAVYQVFVHSEGEIEDESWLESVRFSYPFIKSEKKLCQGVASDRVDE